jgi:hypothetical protein
MRVIFSAIALKELEAAVAHYEGSCTGLGGEFKQVVKKAALRIAEYPEAWSIERGDIRKCLLHTFPYKLLYSVEPDHIFVIAVAHQHRQPDYWVDRQEK